MPKIIIVYDPIDSVEGFTADAKKQLGIKEASLSLPEDLEGIDIYNIAKKLAELLLEQF